MDTPKEPKKTSFPLKGWHYAMVLVGLYFIWGEFFPEPIWINQVVFNFALFYPVGFISGYFKDPGGIQRVIRISFVFNLMTYVLAIAARVKIPFYLAGIDFLTMVLFIYLGTLMGKRIE